MLVMGIVTTTTTMEAVIGMRATAVVLATITTCARTAFAWIARTTPQVTIVCLTSSGNVALRTTLEMAFVTMETTTQDVTGTMVIAVDHLARPNSSTTVLTVTVSTAPTKPAGMTASTVLQALAAKLRMRAMASATMATTMLDVIGIRATAADPL